MSAPPVLRGGGWVLLVCLLLVAVISTATPDPATDVRRRWDDVQVGEWGQLDRVSARVTGVRLTRSALTQYDRPIVSEVTLVVVDFEASVRLEQVAFGEVTLHTADERDYDPRAEFGGLAYTQPGFTRRATLVFEVPDDRVAGAELRVNPDGGSFDVYSAAARVDLGLTRDTPLDTGPIRVGPPVVEVTS